jgi:uncharacterized protein (TIGR00730 family)
MNVTVFGGAQPKEGDAAYAEARELGRLLARAGHAVLTGGYIGTMEAVSRGANEAGGHVIGVTCDEIETWRGTRANAWVQEERHFQTLEQRLIELVHACDAAIALPGGPGTLTEIALTWNLMIVDSMPRKPLVLIGEGWKKVLAAFEREFAMYTSHGQKNLISFAGTVHEACELVSGQANGKEHAKSASL